MTALNRRDVCVALSSFAALAMGAEGQSAPGGASAGVHDGTEPVLSAARVYRFEDLAVTTGPNGESRAVLRGVLPTGEVVEMHETTLLPGHMPHPAHTHRHSELMMIREGTLEFAMDGRTERAGPGGVLYAASGVRHGLKNVGETPANYCVIAIGRES
ncbi:MAG: cupin domain-containing protein [Acidobacteriota bacterium]|nr:cupin domain-containing protein [Acidobacteriota bacterium]